MRKEKETKTKRPAWMTERRDWRVYTVSPSGDGFSLTAPRPIYVGLTSRPLALRLREHRYMVTKASKCPLHVAMREKHGQPSWHILTLETVCGAAYDDAKRVEKQHKAAIANRKGVRLLNRGTLSC